MAGARGKQWHGVLWLAVIRQVLGRSSQTCHAHTWDARGRFVQDGAKAWSLLLLPKTEDYVASQSLRLPGLLAVYGGSVDVAALAGSITVGVTGTGPGSTSPLSSRDSRL